MNPQYSITTARPQNLARLPAIELAAARLLAGHAPESVLNETTGLEVLQKAGHEGHLWVALADDVAVGFAHVEVIEGDAVHLEEIDVAPAHASVTNFATVMGRPSSAGLTTCHAI